MVKPDASVVRAETVLKLVDNSCTSVLSSESRFRPRSRGAEVLLVFLNFSLRRLNGLDSPGRVRESNHIQHY